MCIVEFTGSPYSGKSFYTNLLENELTNEGYPVFNYKKNIFYNIHHAYKLNIFEKLYFYLSKNRIKSDEQHSLKSKKKIQLSSQIKKLKITSIDQKKIFNKILNEFIEENTELDLLINDFFKKNKFEKNREKELIRWQKNLSVSKKIIEKSSKRKIIIDSEGFIHRLNSYLLQNSDDLFIDKYLYLVPKPDILVYVNEDINECFERLENIDNLADKKLTKVKIKIFKANCEKVFLKYSKKNFITFEINKENFSEEKKNIIKSIKKIYENSTPD